MKTAILSRGITFTKYVAAVRVGEYLTREDFAELFGVHVSTATYHVERAVLEGMLCKEYGYISNQPGWLYFLPETEKNDAEIK